MASDLQVGTGLGSPQKKGLYKELHQNPYLLGLSAVSFMRLLVPLYGIRSPLRSLPRLVASCSAMTKVWYLES